MIIELQAGLKTTELRRDPRDLKNMLESTVPEARAEKRSYPNNDYRNPVITPAWEVVFEHSIPDTADFYHQNYIAYLTKAYNHHRGIVLTPDIMWHAILHELATAVVENPKTYGSIFTTDPDKQTPITVNGGLILPLDAIILALKALVPVEIDQFLPEFSTTTPLARMARYANFAEMCSPYYSYGTLACGYPAIDVRGTVVDYTSMIQRIAEMRVTFAAVENAAGPLVPYLQKLGDFMAGEFLPAYTAKDGSFFKRILTTSRCGSGSQHDVHGWWPEIMYRKSQVGQFPHNTPTQVSRVEYTNLDSGRAFTMNCGLFWSKDENGFLLPEWGYVVNEVFENLKNDVDVPADPFALPTAR